MSSILDVHWPLYSMSPSFSRFYVQCLITKNTRYLHYWNAYCIWSNTVYQPTASAEHEDDDDFVEEVNERFEQGGSCQFGDAFSNNTVSKQEPATKKQKSNAGEKRKRGESSKDSGDGEHVFQVRREGYCNEMHVIKWCCVCIKQLSNKRRIAVRAFSNGLPSVDIRETYTDKNTGELKYGKGNGWDLVKRIWGIHIGCYRHLLALESVGNSQGTDARYRWSHQKDPEKVADCTLSQSI